MVSRGTVLKVLLLVVVALLALQYMFNLSVHITSFGVLRDFIYHGNVSVSVDGSLRKTSLAHQVPQTNGSTVKHSTGNSLSNDTKSNSTKILPSSQVTVSNTKVVVTVNGSLPVCPPVPPNLVGRLATFTDSPSFDDIQKWNPNVQPGGRYKPTDCIARHRVAIIIPYRDRELQLRALLHNLHPILTRQQLDYGIYVVEMAQPTKFNRAILMNIGFAEANKIYDYQCYVFHDVDLIPEDDRNVYSCPENPRHMSAAIDKFKYQLPYGSIFGGVCALRKEHMEKINGFSNKYFGWGGEDDDIYNRVVFQNLTIIRYPMEIARYRMIKHGEQKGNLVNPERFQLLYQGKKRFSTDGLNSLKYKLLKVEFRKMYTWIYASVNETEILKT